MSPLTKTPAVQVAVPPPDDTAVVRILIRAVDQQRRVERRERRRRRPAARREHDRRAAIDVARRDGPARDRLAGRRGDGGHDLDRRGDATAVGRRHACDGRYRAGRTGDVDCHDGRCRHEPLDVDRDVAERVGADEVLVRRVDERAVRVQTDGAVKRVAVEPRGERRRRVRVAIVREHAGRQHRERVVARGRERVVHRERAGRYDLDRDRDRRRGESGAVDDEIRETVGAREIRGRRVGERTVRAQQQVAGGDAGSEPRLDPVARVWIAVVREEPRRRHVQSRAGVDLVAVPAAVGGWFVVIVTATSAVPHAPAVSQALYAKLSAPLAPAFGVKRILPVSTTAAPRVGGEEIVSVAASIVPVPATSFASTSTRTEPPATTVNESCPSVTGGKSLTTIDTVAVFDVL